MQDDSMAKYREDTKVDALDNQEGVVETYSAFTLELSDEAITKVLNERINDSRTFWNDSSSFDLKNRRERNNRFVTGDQWYNSSIVSNGTPYTQNEIFTAEQVITAYATARLSEVEVYPSQDTPESRRLATNISGLLRYHSENHNLQGILCNVVMSMLNNYVGIIELEWDANCGPNGDIKPSFVSPRNVIVDKRAEQSKNPAFFSRNRQNSAEELIAMFPKAEKKIRDKVQDKLQSPITWRNVHVTVYIKSKPTEAVVAYFDDVVLAKNKTPHWIYDEETEGVTNYLPQPQKPIIPFNYINDGSHWIDRYGPIDQVIPLQEMINRIGRQIQKGVAHSSPVLVFNQKALPKPSADRVKGEPWEKILVDAQDVRSAYGVIQANQIPAFVVDEIQRLAASLHEIFGTPPQLRGESNNNQTATQDIMARNQAQGRQDLLVRSIDRGLDAYFNALLHMVKVHYTEDHFVSVLGEDGRYDFFAIKRDDIEDGVKVRVKAGSTLPMDKSRLQQVAMELANMGKISLLSLYEFLDIPNPGKHVDRVLKEQVDPVTTIEDIKNDEQDGNAVEDYELIKQGQEVQPRDDVDTRHIKTHKKQLLSNDFMMLPVEVQGAFKNHLQAELDKLMAINNLTQDDLYPQPEQVGIDAGISIPEAITPPETIPSAGTPTLPPPEAPASLPLPPVM